MGLTREVRSNREKTELNPKLVPSAGTPGGPGRPPGLPPLGHRHAGHGAASMERKANANATCSEFR